MDTILHVGKRYVRAADLARAASVSPTAVYRAIRAGRLSSASHLGARLVPLSEAQVYIKKDRAK